MHPAIRENSRGRASSVLQAGAGGFAFIVVEVRFPVKPVKHLRACQRIKTNNTTTGEGQTLTSGER